MSNKKPSAVPVNLFFLLIFIIICIVFVAVHSKDIRMLLVIIGLPYFVFMCNVISLNNRQTKLARLPELTSPAVLIEKIKEDHRHSSAYFLSFELSDQSRKLFKVNRDIFTKYLENETDLLIYKENGDLIELIRFEKKNDLPAK